ncbi:MAG: putative addiction module antidote protein [Thiothrix sp.]|nr:putative addiction module antidote protein [Thiothrix sp.]HPQ94280.1 putative addiction module antidote protein [Thiolinea sp.]
MNQHVTLKKWDVVEHLKTPEDLQLYLDACMETGDVALITAALGDIARAHGMTQLARETGLAPEALYRSLSGQGNPEFSTILKVVDALGLRLQIVPRQAA